jgi:UDP-glucose 4-epimerase
MYGIYDISRARNELGYRPQFDLERGVADYLESLQRLKLQAA